MTEDEAALKRCCGPDGCGHFNDNPFPARWCIGSACMAWRWNDPWTSQTEEGHGGDIVVRLKRKPGEPKLGYCGLAGAPL